MYDKAEFEKLTQGLFKLPEGRAWLRMAKLHPEIKFYSSACKMGKGTESGTHFYDGVQHPFRIIDLILETAKTK
jgi:hypothetical protein